MENETKGQPGPTTGKEYSVQGFSEVEVSSAVEFEITQSPDYSVRATGDERLIERLQVEVSGQEYLLAGHHRAAIELFAERDETRRVVVVHECRLNGPDRPALEKGRRV